MRVAHCHSLAGDMLRAQGVLQEPPATTSSPGLACTDPCPPSPHHVPHHVPPPPSQGTGTPGPRPDPGLWQGMGTMETLLKPAPWGELPLQGLQRAEPWGDRAQEQIPSRKDTQ